ncbi:hypothetical protein LX87_01027 [Larkinella arboricola]|uniref:Uncharacterized protein n=1 Tax=Larkinella arboricola TaxID=643671 RepID=A0A327XFD3_LARAB|nr:hypothetical protein [Larkinella arboricola]RAK02906.1 hypothetical protein LX87_01027 [Larkinella arboricola]
MNRTEKLKVLENLLEGNNEKLRELHCERQKKAMPYLEVYGFVNIRQCSPLLLDVLVMPTASIIDHNRKVYIPLRDCLRRFDAIDTFKYPYYPYSAVGSIDVDDYRFDAVQLDSIQIRYPDYSNRYLKGGTIADLRRYFNQSASAFDLYPILLLSFETDASR